MLAAPSISTILTPLIAIIPTSNIAINNDQAPLDGAGDAEWISPDALEIPKAAPTAQFDFGPTTRMALLSLKRSASGSTTKTSSAMALRSRRFSRPSVGRLRSPSVCLAVLKERKAPHKLSFISLLKFSRIGWLNTQYRQHPRRYPAGAVTSGSAWSPKKAVTRGSVYARTSEGIRRHHHSAGTRSIQTKNDAGSMLKVLFFLPTTPVATKPTRPMPRQFMSAFNRRQAPISLPSSTLSNPDNQWATPISSATKTPQKPRCQCRPLYQRTPCPLKGHRRSANPRALSGIYLPVFFFVLLLSIPVQESPSIETDRF